MADECRKEGSYRHMLTLVGVHRFYPLKELFLLNGGWLIREPKENYLFQANMYLTLYNYS